MDGGRDRPCDPYRRALHRPFDLPLLFIKLIHFLPLLMNLKWFLLKVVLLT
jgi:hypothetical protein